MTTTDTSAPVTTAAQPDFVPWQGFLSGAYRVRLLGQGTGSPDHLMVYLRGAGGNERREYAGLTTICGLDLYGAFGGNRRGSACPACVYGADQAFTEARRDLADQAIRLE